MTTPIKPTLAQAIETPRTDGEVFHAYTRGSKVASNVVRSDFARQLEREVITAAKEVGELRKENTILLAERHCEIIKVAAGTNVLDAQVLQSKLTAVEKEAKKMAEWINQVGFYCAGNALTQEQSDGISKGCLKVLSTETAKRYLP